MIDLKPSKPKFVIHRKDLRRETFRAGGKGGQHQNKTESAVRYIHIPTGIRAESRSDRSQFVNDDLAMKLLISKLVARAQDQIEAASNANYQAKPEASYGSQLRSYFLDRDRRVVDHKTGMASGNPGLVLKGQIDDFIGAALRSRI